MRHFTPGLAILAVSLLVSCQGDVAAPENDAASQLHLDVTVLDGCHVSARGTIPNGDRFVGSTIDGSSGPAGRWINRTADGRLFLGFPESITCSQNGTILTTILGTCTFDGEDGLIFAIVFQDRQDPAQADFYAIRIYTPDENLLYTSEGDFDSGDMRTTGY